MGQVRPLHPRHEPGRYRVVDPAWPEVPAGSPFDGMGWDSATKTEAMSDAKKGAKWYGALSILDTTTGRLVGHVAGGRRHPMEA